MIRPMAQAPSVRGALAWPANGPRTAPALLLRVGTEREQDWWAKEHFVAKERHPESCYLWSLIHSWSPCSFQEACGESQVWVVQVPKGSSLGRWFLDGAVVALPTWVRPTSSRSDEEMCVMSPLHPPDKKNKQTIYFGLCPGTLTG